MKQKILYCNCSFSLRIEIDVVNLFSSSPMFYGRHSNIFDVSVKEIVDFIFVEVHHFMEQHHHLVAS